MTIGIKGRLHKIQIDVGEGSTIDLAAHDVDPAVVVFSDDPKKPNPIIQALQSTPPSKRFTLMIEVDMTGEARL